MVAVEQWLHSRRTHRSLCQPDADSYTYADSYTDAHTGAGVSQ